MKNKKHIKVFLEEIKVDGKNFLLSHLSLSALASDGNFDYIPSDHEINLLSCLVNEKLSRDKEVLFGVIEGSYPMKKILDNLTTCLSASLLISDTYSFCLTCPMLSEDKLKQFFKIVWEQCGLGSIFIISNANSNMRNLIESKGLSLIHSDLDKIALNCDFIACTYDSSMFDLWTVNKIWDFDKLIKIASKYNLFLEKETQKI